MQNEALYKTGNTIAEFMLAKMAMAKIYVKSKVVKCLYCTIL